MILKLKSFWKTIFMIDDDAIKELKDILEYMKSLSKEDKKSLENHSRSKANSRGASNLFAYFVKFLCINAIMNLYGIIGTNCNRYYSNKFF
jgi:hypothetical protein